MWRALECPLMLVVIVAAADGATPAITSVVSGGSFRSDAVASGAFATIFGSNLSDNGYSGSLPWPTTLGGVSVTVCDAQGKNCVAPQLTYVNATQVNLLMPVIPNLPSTGAVNETLYLTVGSVKSNTLIFQIKAYSPDIFFVGYDCLIDPTIQYRDTDCGLSPTQAPAQAPAGPYQAYRGTLTDQSGHLIYSGNPATLGQYYTLWVTGLGFNASTKQPSPDLGIQVLNIPFYDSYQRKFLNPTVDYLNASFAGPSPQFPGLWQINLQLPTYWAAGNPPSWTAWPCGNYDLELKLGVGQDYGPSVFFYYPVSIDVPVQIKVGEFPCQ
jgi:uncharacterized protein (TIGR03437 family)